jgi:hypothetical protein
MSNEAIPDEKPTLFAVLTEYAYCLIVFLFAAALLGGLFWSAAPVLTEQCWYSVTKHVPRARVFVSQRPMDCYVDRAASGKRCHYERVVDVGKDSAGNTQVTVHWQKAPD